MEKHSSRCSTRIYFGAIVVSNIYINDLPEGTTLQSNIIADGTSFFSKTINRKHSEVELNKDWKMLFNPDPTKQAVEKYFFYINILMLIISL